MQTGSGEAAREQDRCRQHGTLTQPMAWPFEKVARNLGRRLGWPVHERLIFPPVGTAMRGRPELSVCELAIRQQFAVSIRSPHVIGPEYLFRWYGSPILLPMALPS